MTNITVNSFIRRLGAVYGLALIGLFLAGCVHQPPFTDVPGVPQRPAAPPAGVGAATAPSTGTQSATAPNGDQDYAHRIRPGDALTITITDIPQAPQPLEERVREDGTILLLQNQRFVAAGKSRSELETEIHDRYVPAFFKNMTVSIRHTPQTQFYYVGGEVKAPGRQVYISRIHLLEAIRSAGDFNDFARKKAVQLIRTDGKKYKINCIKALQDPELNLEVFPGDQVFVPRRNPFW